MTDRIERIGVLHVIDTLDLGGAERMAVSIVNHLSRERFRPFLCATRREGLLKEEIKPGVGYLCLHRKGRFDLLALARFVSFTKQNNIEIIHAHSLSLFFCVIAALFMPHHIRLIWHDHGFGEIKSIKERYPLPYSIALMKCHAVIAVNTHLAKWAQENSIVKHVVYVPNFPETKNVSQGTKKLPGILEKRIICVANLRPVKNQETLIRAMKIISNKEKEAHLFLVGTQSDEKYTIYLLNLIAELNLKRQVTWLGQRNDVANLLSQCAIGALSSRSEGLPVALLEYGAAGLAVVATDVGQCAEIIQNGQTGFLVASEDAQALADTIQQLLSDSELRTKFGKNLKDLVKKKYSAASVIPQIENLYEIMQND